MTLGDCGACLLLITDPALSHCVTAILLIKSVIALSSQLLSEHLLFHGTPIVAARMRDHQTSVMQVPAMPKNIVSFVLDFLTPEG